MRTLFLLTVAFLALASATPPARGQFIISEFMASNTRTLADEDGSFEDWIEIHNTGESALNLLDWSLTDTASNLAKWRFPSTNVPPHGFLVVFASNKNRRVPGAPLHTNFKLDATGEYLALVAPDGLTIATAFASTYPSQAPDVSFGYGMDYRITPLISSSSPARVLIPADDSLGASWSAPGLVDTDWTPAAPGVGFVHRSADTGPVGAADLKLRLNFDAAPVGTAIQDTKPAGTPHPGVNKGAQWSASILDSANPGVRRDGVMTFVGTDPDQITVGADPDFNSTQGTICFWIRSAGTVAPGTGGAMLFDRRTTMGDVIVQQADGRLLVQAVGGVGLLRNTFSTARGLADNRWHHVAYVYDQSASGSIAIYVDGYLDTVQNNSGAWAWDPAAQIEIGQSHDSFWRRFNGQLDDFRIYARRLEAQEVERVAGDDTGPPDLPGISTSLDTAMHGVNATAYLRIPFTVDDPSQVDRLTLRLRYDDGFAAFLNGIPVASALAPEVPQWNSAATGVHEGPAARTEEIFDVTPFRQALRPGTNILAIQGLNQSASDDSFLILPQLEMGTFGALTAAPRYFVVPTPGAVNGIGTADLGPIIGQVGHTPATPADGEDLVVTARIAPALLPVGGVSLYYRIMFGPTNSVPMFDDGLHQDGAAGDLIYAGTIPAAASTNGQMIRYYIGATDTAGHPSRWPLFEDPLGSAEYLGTVVQDPAVTSRLPIYQLFVKDAGSEDFDSGTAASLYYDGEFYDNVHVRLKGGTTRGLNKKSHRVDFNKEHKFRYDQSGRRLREMAFNAEYVDPSYIRQTLSFETYTRGGTMAPLHFPARLQRNGVFHQLIFPNETLDTEMLTRQGLDTDGALYKNALMLNIIGEPAIGGRDMLEGEKQTRLYEDKSDLVAFGSGIAETNTVAGRRRYLFDNIDVPEIVNFMALFDITQQGDAVHANVCPYRDSNNTLEWNLRPWDMNISFGQVYGGPTIAATNDAVDFTHPFYGASAYRLPGVTWSFNRMYDTFIVVPETRAMYLRRLRTLMEELLQPPETHPALLGFEKRIAELRELLRPEATLDRAKWGWDGGINRLGNLSIDVALDQMIREYLVPRRRHLFITHNIDSPYVNSARIPNSQPADATLLISAVEFNPASGNQDEEFVQLINTNSYSVDITGWKLGGAVDFTFRPGTVLATNGTLYVSPNVRAFRQRATSPRGGENRFVQGPYRGQLSARGETVTLTDRTGRLVHSLTYAGNPGAAQQFLRITEMMYSPEPPPGNAAAAQDFEYLELRNISASIPIDLAGVHFGNGIEFAFPASPATMLAPGARIVLVKNPAAFATRYGPGATVAGTYAGSLDNSGERLTLLDAGNEEILDFSYRGSWYPITDGFGFSLVVADENAAPDEWGNRAQWRPSGTVGGAPGLPDPAPAALPRILINEILTHTDTPPPTDAVELFNPGPEEADVSGWFLTDDFRVPKKFRIPEDTRIPAGGYRVFTEAQFNPTPGVGLSFSFSARGDEAWLFSGDAGTNLTGYVTGQTFGAQENGVSFGRHVTSTGAERFVAQRAFTPGAANAGPRTGPVVISEIMYHPPDLAGAIDNTDDEFIELRNISGDEVKFFHPTATAQTWQLGGGVSFVFPPARTLPANGSLLVVGFDPTNLTQLASFRARYRVPDLTPILGPYSGRLGNNSDRIELRKPDLSGAAQLAFVVADEVSYTDTAPWPEPADGHGAALQRIHLDQYGDDPANWTAALASPGADQAGGQPPVITVQPVSQDVIYGTTAALIGQASGSQPMRYQWRYEGSNLAGATNSTLILSPVQLEQTGRYSLTVWNAAGADASSNALLRVLVPAFIGQQPQNQYAKPTSNATFTVVASSQTPLRYQWRFNRTPIPGATNSTLVVTNVQLASAGNYSAEIRDAISTVISSNATLFVLVPPAIVRQPLSMSVPTGATVTLSITVSDTATRPLGFRWRRTGATVGNFALNDTTCFFTITNIQAGGSYSVVITNAANLSGLLSASAVITLVSDTDRDGMPDAWETAHNLDPNNALDATRDDDHDGQSNLEEYLAGTDPNDASSYLRLEHDDPRHPGTLRFNAVSNRTYTVEWKESTGLGRWFKLADVAAQPSNRVEILPDRYPLAANRIYRLLTPGQATSRPEPVILQSPESQIVDADGTARLRVVAVGADPLRYQWQFNGDPIPGATNSELNLPSLQVSGMGAYSVTIESEAGLNTNPAPALLAVRPLLVSQPADRSGAINESTTFAVTAAGVEPLRYLWTHDGKPLVGETNATLTLPSLKPGDAGSYQVTVTHLTPLGRVGTVSRHAVLTVR